MRIYVYGQDHVMYLDHFISEYKSFVWAERHSDIGDFELVLSQKDYDPRVTIGTIIGIEASNRAMTVETLDFSEGLVTITGRSMEVLLTNRTVSRQYTDTSTGPWGNRFRLTTPTRPSLFIARVVARSLGPGYSGGYPTSGYIPRFRTQSLVSEDTIPYNEATVRNLYDEVKYLCTLGGYGFRVVTTTDSNWDFSFQVFIGVDRSDSVIFSIETGTLESITLLRSVANYKNVADVIYGDKAQYIQRVYPPGVPASVSSYDRRALYVDALHLPQTGTIEELHSDAMVAGLQALAGYNQVDMFEGVISRNTNYIYGVDYNLGDIVGVYNPIDNEIVNKQVTEYVWSVNESGLTQYPTLKDPEEG